MKKKKQTKEELKAEVAIQFVPGVEYFLDFTKAD